MSELSIQTLLKQSFQDPAMNRLADRHASVPVNVFGPSDQQKAWLWAALAAKTRKPPCILVPDELRARSLAADLQVLADQPVLVFRPRELNLTDAEAVSRDSERKHMAILSSLCDNRFGAIIIPASACLQKLMPRRMFLDHLIRLSVGAQINPDDLTGQLLQNGYERMRTASGPGQFARRGDIIDIVPEQPEDGDTEEGIRLSFFDVEIDAIKSFELESQRSDCMLESCVIPPAHEIILDPKRRDELAGRVMAAGENAATAYGASPEARQALDHARRLCRQDVQRIEAGISFAGIDRWISFVYDAPDTILDYAAASGTWIYVDEMLRFNNRLDAAQADFAERFKTMMAKGQLLPETAEAVFTSMDIGRQLTTLDGVTAVGQIAAAGNGLPGAESVDIQGRPADGFRGREDRLVEQLGQWQSEGQMAVLFAGSDSRRHRLLELTSEHGVACQALPQALPRGFSWPKAGLHVVGTHDIFGSERTARRRKHAGIKIDLFSDLVPGEMVVHEIHGIGRYDGLAQLDSKGAKRDYLKISYAGDDTLYIPMESLDQIQKFVGAGGKEPRLSKLSGQEWNRLKERAKESIRKLAVDLQKLYAEREAVKGHKFAADTVWQQEFEENFPYEETQDQIRSIQEIKQDMETDKVMDRLLCGDVGFGKTEVAFRAMFKSVMDGRQAAMLAPTTVLAQQHFENLHRRMTGFPVSVGLLSRFASDAMQKNTVRGLSSGNVDIVVGTHRMLSKDVTFKNLGLLVVDEEQRFGVDHKEKVKSISPEVDVLTLTATPIPRTLHMSMSGIRDISVLEEPPHDRRPVQTYVMEYDEGVVTEAMLREISRQGQVFYLFNDTRKIIEKTNDIEKALPGARVAYAHGKMSEKRLEEIITEFIDHQYDILVCTTIIESGIDMPNVNTIIVENADRLGLSQLYQLRGRVGRSDRQAFAYVTYRRDKVLSEIAEKRLAAIRDFTELGAGFKIALRDLEVRGAGNLLGAEQHGHLDAIGYDLYCRMLENTIQELKGETAKAKISATIDLDVDAFLSKKYIPDEGLRMDMYRRVAAIASATDYRDVLDEWLDRFGEPPKPAVTLADIAFVRAQAEQHGFGKISRQGTNLVLTYANEVQPDMQMLSALLGQDQFKGMLLFNAGSKPYVVFRNAAVERVRAPEKLRLLFLSVEQAEHKPKETPA